MTLDVLHHRYIIERPANFFWEFERKMSPIKSASTCFDLIQIIFREFIRSLLKLLILKFVKNVKVNVVMRQHNIWCVYVLSV